MKSVLTLRLGLVGLAGLVFAHSLAFAQLAPVPVVVPAPVGEIKGSAVEHTLASAEGVVQRAALVLPASATGAGVYAGTFADAPKDIKARVPVVVFLHGSSGLGLKAIGQ